MKKAINWILVFKGGYKFVKLVFGICSIKRNKNMIGLSSDKNMVAVLLQDDVVIAPEFS